MNSAAGPFESFYAGSIQHPILLWLAAGAALAYCLWRRDLGPDPRRYCLALGILSLFDAWLTSDPVFGIGSLPESIASAVPLFFVLAGDARFLLLVTTATPEGTITIERRSLLHAAALTLVVPLFTQVVMTGLPASLQTPRVMFLIYELAFVCLASVLLRRHPNVSTTPWLRRLSGFVVLYYSLWAASDAWILFGGADAGFLLRVLPNLLYYGGFIAAVAWLAPRPDRIRRSPSGY